ncbi:TPA: RNA-directed DNA polymerase [Pseudomonas aeruginosa]|nr:RNA-directed DNA polymerase [Pseudomonas aeruginosa]
MSNPNANKIKKNDINRILVTETIPYETPLIFSNDGFYKICNLDKAGHEVLNRVFQTLVVGDGRSKYFTTPYQYKIRKNLLEYRKLSVIHPISQWEMKDFYQKNETLICHYCSESTFTIRAPLRTASIFYYKNSWENVGKYKRGGVEEEDNEMQSKHSSSFYTYRGYDRLYKFFNSSEFLSLEKKYSHLRTLDVSKCFDSIYTHSIAWATKEKQYVKSRIGPATFGAAFDSLMQRANYNETNGILIGPEISRIFAEIIFQDIDKKVKGRLQTSPYKLEQGKHYDIKRYVDDVFIFALSEKYARKIHEIYSDHLTQYNLHTNSSKSQEYSRPFFTPKSRVIREVNTKVNEFFEKFLESKSENSVLTPLEIHRTDRMAHSFIDSIKSTCSSNNIEYDEVSSYLISAFFERTKRLINVNKIENQIDLKNYKDTSILFIDLLFFFYSVAPSVSASYKLCASMILLSRFSETHLETHEHTIKHRIFQHTLELLESDFSTNTADVDNFIFLEALNIVLAASEMGDEYLLPPHVVSKVFDQKNSYYDLIACLFYIKGRAEYREIHDRTVDEIEKKLSDLTSIQVHAELACLFLDSISCPYIDRRKKEKWILRVYRVTSTPRPSQQALREFINNSSSHFWFTNWNEVDLLNALERKELRHVY